MFEAFILRFADSFYAEVARARLAELRQAQVTHPLTTSGASESRKICQRSDAPVAPIGQQSALAPAPAITTSLEARARDFLEEYMRVSSGPESDYLALLQRVFDANVDYYGKRVTKEAILEEQRKIRGSVAAANVPPEARCD